MARFNRGRIFPLLLALVVIIVGFLVNYKKCESQSSQEIFLSNNDCIKCHKKETSLINTKGGKHKDVGCLKCHKGHYPEIAKEKMIPACSECHYNKEHYKLEGCNRCHQNPHTPLVISLEKGEYKKECATCHASPYKDLEKFKSKHTELTCNFCHTQHREKPECLKCHSGHLKEQTNKDCYMCHKPHSPTKVIYPNEVPNKYCEACHEKQGLDLKATTTKHSKLTCAFCHRNEHKTVPSCETCHGAPHPQAMLKAFKGCNDCHNDAHLLVK
ncbi:MAG: cytochrome C [Thermosulfidibacteraceae bacterium]|jgi:hypothetical protein